MKGLLLGTTQLMLSGKKRRRVEAVNANKKRAVSDEAVKTIDDTATEEEADKTSSIAFEGNSAIVYLEPEQLLAFDGCAFVCLLEGNSSFLGYSLVRGVQMLVSSDSRLGSALTFEARSSNNGSGCRLEFQPRQQDTLKSFTLELVQQKVPSLSRDMESRRKRKAVADVPVRNTRPTITPSTWWAETDSITEPQQSVPPIVLVCGTKGSGKSTFGRFLVNRLLKRYNSVAYLDADLGQPEFTIPGCLSLHVLEAPVTGPPPLHLREPERCFFFGDISSKTDPELFMKLMMKLYDFFRHQYYSDAQRLPLVINTAGWLSGIGYDVLVDILRYTVPTHVVKIGDNDLPEGHFWNPVDGPSNTTITCVNSFSFSEPSCLVTPAELRDFRILAYFQQCIEKRPVLDEYASTATALAGLVPYQVSAADVNVVNLHVQVPPSQNLYSLNAQLVGLAIANSSNSDAEHDPKMSHVVGFGLIRGVNTISNILYMLTPCSLELLQDVNTVLHGRVELPAALLQGKGYACPYLCRQSVLVEGTGSSILRRRRKTSRLR